MNIVLIIIPLVSLIFGMIYLYNSREFMELLLTQPVARKHVFLGMFFGISVPLALIYLIGIYLPFQYSGIDMQNTNAYLNLGVTGIVLTFIFTALAFYLSTIFEDKVKGLGLAVLLWLFFIVIYDGIILIVLFVFADYPLDNISIVFSLINPINLGRIFLLLQLDVAALMGYTGAVFSRFFGGTTGIIVSLFSMVIWVFTPFFLGQKKFLKKDF
jgi:Cu-processing system permease protein